MTQTPPPEFVQTLIVLANSRKEMLAAAMVNARKSLEATAQTPWHPYVETAAEKRANARAERIDALIRSL
jgi:hypothetical protein